jgi:PTS system fructose-specific IIC component
MIAEALRYADDPAAPRVAGDGGGSSELDGPRRRRRVVGWPHPPRPDDRRLVHDPVRRGGRPADRPQLPARRLRDHQPLRRRRRARTRSLQPARPGVLVLDHALFDSGLLAYIGACSSSLGKTAFGFFVPALAGYIAYAIADRPGIAPGFVMGGLGQPTSTCGRHDPQTGFLGGIIGGVLAGLVAHWIAS